MVHHGGCHIAGSSLAVELQQLLYSVHPWRLIPNEDPDHVSVWWGRKVRAAVSAPMRNTHLHQGALTVTVSASAI